MTERLCAIVAIYDVPLPRPAAGRDGDPAFTEPAEAVFPRIPPLKAAWTEPGSMPYCLLEGHCLLESVRARFAWRPHRRGRDQRDAASVRRASRSEVEGKGVCMV